MKKILTVLLCGTLTLTLTACGEKSNSTVRTPSASTVENDIYKEPTNGAVITDDQTTPTSDKTTTNTASSTAQNYEIEDDLGGVNILAYQGVGVKFSIPSKIDGKNVIKIDEYAFRGTPVTNVIIPSTVKTIETRAFTGCSKLELLTVSDGVKVIDGYAFANCPKLSLVTLPDSVVEISNGAFDDCPNLMLTYRGKTYTAANVEELYDFF